MLDKLYRAFELLRKDVAALTGDVRRVEKVRQVVKHGVDGVSPDRDEIVSAVLAKIPAPVDGVSPDPQAIAEAAAKLIPAPKPGRDAIPPTVRDVADVVLAKIERPKDGKSPDVNTVAIAAAKLIPAPQDGKSPTAAAVAAKLPAAKRGAPGKDGKDGVSVTDVQLKSNELFVFLDGKKRSAGKIKLAAASAPFRPGADSGGGGSRTVTQPNKDDAIYLASQADFTNQDENGIYLAENTPYIPVASFSVDKDIFTADGSSVRGRSLDGHTITRTGAVDKAMFVGVDASFGISDVSIDPGIGNKAFDFKDNVGGTKKLIIREVLAENVGSWGTSEGMLLLQVFNSSSPNCDTGFTLVGTANVILSINQFANTSTNAGFIGIDLGSSTQIVNEIKNLFFTAPVGAAGVSGLPDSGNMPPGRLGMMEGCEFGGGMTDLVGLKPSDIRWDMDKNTPTSSSVNAADMYLTGGAETITITTPGVFEEIGTPSAGGVSWASDVADRFEVGLDGVITYVGERDIFVQVIGGVTVEKVGGGSDELETRIAKNWLPGQSGLVKSRAITQNSTPTSVPISALTGLSTGDNLRPIFANNSGMADIIAVVTSLDVVGVA